MSADLVRDTVDVIKKPVQAYRQSRPKHAATSATLSIDNPLPAKSYPPHAMNKSLVGGASGATIPHRPNSRNCMSGVGAAASASAGGVGNLVGHWTRATYVDVPLALAEGLRAVPKFYGGAIRDYGNVTDWKSGFSKAGKHIVFGIADGLVDMCMEPVICGKKEGGLGVMKGVGKGLVSITTKVSSGQFPYPLHTNSLNVTLTNRPPQCSGFRHSCLPRPGDLPKHPGSSPLTYSTNHSTGSAKRGCIPAV